MATLDTVDELRIGVFVCDCGLNIAGAVDCGAESDSLDRPSAPHPKTDHDCCLASNRLAMRSHQRSMPSPVVEETTRMTPVGLSEDMWFVTVSRSNGT